MDNETTRKKLIIEARQLGGLAIPHLKLQVHQNGAKFPISRVYVDDEQLDTNTFYTIIAIPELSKGFRIVLTYFHRKEGPKVLYGTPKELIDKEIVNSCINWMDNYEGAGMHPEIGRDFHSLNYFFELSSEWASGNKEIVMISVISDSKLNEILQDNISTELSKIIESMKQKAGLFKVFYKKIDEMPNQISEVEKKKNLSEIEKMNRIVTDLIDNILVFCKQKVNPTDQE